MEQRRTELKEGAGLLESRLNQDFIDWLRKWGFWILLTLAIASLSYAGLRELRSRQVIALDNAFRAHRDAQISGSPDSLLAVASEHRGKGAVWELATLDAADIYLKSARSGVTPGGISGLDDDLLGDQARIEMAQRAGRLYQDVYEATRHDDAQLMLALGARWGMAAVRVIEKDFDGAQTILREIAQRADAGGYGKLGRVAELRLARLDDLELAAPLPHSADLPRRPDEAAQSGGAGGVPDLLAAPTGESMGSSEFAPFVDPTLDDLRTPTPPEPPAESEGGGAPPPPPAQEPAQGGGGSGGGAG